MAKKTKVIDINTKEVVEEVESTELNQEAQGHLEGHVDESGPQGEMGIPMPKLDADQRAILISEYNRNNDGVAAIDESVLETTLEYQEECKKDFERVVEEANNMKFVIADAESAVETAVFLADWNANKNHWHRAYWKGVIKFNEFIEEQIAKLENNEVAELVFDYAALVFCYNCMMNPQGVGLEAALEMEKIDDQYNAILNVIGDYIDKLRLYDIKSKLYQERWGLACNGFKMDILIDKLEDFANVDMTQRQ